MYGSFFLSFFKNVESGFFLKVNFDISWCELFVGVFYGADSVFNEVLLGFIDWDSGEWWSVESDSCSLTDNDAWKNQLVQNWWVYCTESSAVWSGLSLVSFNPSGLNISSTDDQNCSLKSFLQFVHQFLIKVCQKNFLASESTNIN